MAILVTGGLGFIGSHFVWAAADADQVIVLDDRSAGTSPPMPPGVEVVVGDVGDVALVTDILAKNRVTDIVHFAGKIEVGESVRNPGLYFDVNLARALRLVECAVAAEVGHFVFSSSAAVYGEPESVPIPETARTEPVNPYGASKLGFEHVLGGFSGSHGLRWAGLRYFNAAGAHPNGHLAEGHQPETHLIPLVLDAGLGRREPLTIFGTDYVTHDGTCLRDYIHVSDLIEGHLLALDFLHQQGSLGPLNLGTGTGYSVREVLATATTVLGAEVPYRVGERRAGDPAALVADPRRAREMLGWQVRHATLSTILEDALRARK